MRDTRRTKRREARELSLVLQARFSAQMGVTMSLFRYSGLTAKVRAMSGKLLTDGAFQEMSSQTTVSEAVAWLKKQPVYDRLLEKEDENNLHRGTVEGIVTRSLFQDFAKLYRFSNMEQRKFLDTYFVRYEITFLKAVIRAIFSGSREELDLSEYREIFSRHSSLDPGRILAAASTEELMAVLEGTVYGALLKQVGQSEKSGLFDYEIALDMLFFTSAWKQIRKGLKSQDREVILQAVGTEMDGLNLQWIYRTKKYYKMASSDIYALIIPIHYKLNREQIKQLVEAADEKEFFAVLGTTRYQRYLPEAEAADLEQICRKIMADIHSAGLSRNPYTAACLDTYLFRKEAEVHKIITLIECIRYGLPADKMKEYLA